jgi:hypothetical protein
MRGVRLGGGGGSLTALKALKATTALAVAVTWVGSVVLTGACTSSHPAPPNPDGTPLDTGAIQDRAALDAAVPDGGTPDVQTPDILPPDTFAPEAPCGAGEVNCGAGCTNLNNDPKNCGACGAPCAPGQTCDGTGHCSTACNAGYALCEQAGGSSSCADLSSDPSNCGVCGTGCIGAETCVDGRCTCTGSTTACAGACVDLNTDPLNCGSCLNACPDHEICTGGTCGCPFGQIDCPGSGCIDPQLNVHNCSTCGIDCGAEYCNGAGKCAKSCGPGLTRCLALPSGIIHDCADLNNDAKNCGTCFNVCAANQICQGGACTCLAPDLLCGIDCVDPSTDPANCGGCARSCPTGALCVNGGCQCPTGLSPCNGACVDLTSDRASCGVCGTGCPGGSCSGGVCGTACASTQTLCGSACVDLTSDPANCGACGALCTGGTCTGGTCTCPGGSVLCPPFGCVPTDTNEPDCGGPGTACATNQICLAGTCQTPPAPTVLYSGPANMTSLALQGSSVFFADASGIEQVPESGGPITNVVPFAGTGVIALAIVGSTYFWSDPTGVHAAPAGGPATLVAPNADLRTSDATAAYGYELARRRILAFPTAGAPRVLAQELAVGSLTEAGGYVFGTTGSDLIRVPVSGSGLTISIAKGAGGNVAAGAGGVFYVAARGLLFVPLQGGAPTPLMYPSPPNLATLALDPSGLDGIEPVDNHLWKLPLCGGPPVLLDGTSQWLLNAEPAVDGSGVYGVGVAAQVIRAPR